MLDENVWENLGKGWDHLTTSGTPDDEIDQCEARHNSVRHHIEAILNNVRPERNPLRSAIPKWSGVGELAGYGDDVHQRDIAPYRDLQQASDRVFDQDALEGCRQCDRLTGDRYDDVTDSQTRHRSRALRHHLRDVQPAAAPGLGHHGRRKGHLRADDTEPGAAHRPCAISVWMIRWVVSLMGTAKPTSMPATAVLTPTTRPELSAGAPPLLPRG